MPNSNTIPFRGGIAPNATYPKKQPLKPSFYIFMKRYLIKERPNWKQKVEAIGFIFHSLEGKYWDESACYAFSEAQIDALEEATKTLYAMCLEAVAKVVREKRLHEFAIPTAFHELVEQSWLRGDTTLYGRFDLAFDGETIKMLEFNADTPTSLLEASVVQWYWLQDFNKNLDQFNSIHEKLLAQFQHFRNKNIREMTFACIHSSQEDYMTTAYLQDCATQAGLLTDFLDIPDIGWDGAHFVGLNEKPIRNLFKLYPWEFIFKEEFSQFIPQTNTKWIEPLWKSILSNKMILKILWEIYPNHPYLLRTECSPSDMKSYVKKPILSREGANIEIFEEGKVVALSAGDYGEEGYIYQEYVELPNFMGNRPVIGSWVIGNEASGIGIRETNGLIHDNLARFVPHYFS
jgi:glutathionylspermidine synthase